MSLTDLGTALFRKLDPETAHRAAVQAARLFPLPVPPADDPVLTTRIAGLTLPNPVGLAAGLDKNGEALHGLARLGFGAVECGSVTPKAQPGNPKPRLFRLTEDRAVINRMGFNNDGLEPFASRLHDRPRTVAIGANLGANKDTEDKAADYVTGLKRLAGLADYFTVNISSPNTPGLRALQGREALDDLLGRINEARPSDGAPVFLKIAPDLIGEEIGMIVEASLAHNIDALIVSNTTLERPAHLKSAFKGETGGLSGEPIKPFARRALQAAAEAAQGRLPLIAVGGIDSGEEAYERIRMGASAVQLYSALVYTGPSLVSRIKSDLVARLKADGFTSISQAVSTLR